MVITMFLAIIAVIVFLWAIAAFANLKHIQNLDARSRRCKGKPLDQPPPLSKRARAVIWIVGFIYVIITIVALVDVWRFSNQ